MTTATIRLRTERGDIYAEAHSPNGLATDHIESISVNITDQVEAIVAERLAERTSALHAAVMQHTATAEAQQARIQAARDVCQGYATSVMCQDSNCLPCFASMVLAALDGTTPQATPEPTIDDIRDAERAHAWALSVREEIQHEIAEYEYLGIINACPGAVFASTEPAGICGWLTSRGYITQEPHSLGVECRITEAGRSHLAQLATRYWSPNVPRDTLPQAGAQDGGQA